MSKKMDGAGNIVRGQSEVLYFNKFFSENFRPEFTTDALMAKNIFLGTERIVTKQCSKDAREGFAEAGTQSEYYYHADHLGSVSAITDSDGDVYERLEYTPYGEVWIDLQYGTTAFDFDTPYKFTGKELDEAHTIAGVLCAGCTTTARGTSTRGTQCGSQRTLRLRIIYLVIVLRADFSIP